ncbi:metal/formaldehyde-sensitive transcriptional repressor [Sphingomonas sp. ABOLD]|jgi:DNA-binding FrmR family transcriptional regulator|uniref:DNA-binding FrmR family transcriptional regulator n=1 Tax=Sphingomonas trueperi TaxID=53317 RepID=A0A7X5XYE7_9SPHN|nr:MULTISPECIES: metal/formaldehyde-sensitive transcriptional repressor [Sphingomonas]NJB97258.1 DNA-binding FrmR family transcriptional regulator [Sphingomonas trueperi]RSV40421.1 metal/formaldehyde-sensitive transcriptional repressor [Sphingomonas sp. ABOLE]RSV49303.1 metal/formaldehyde-sensitive transcriptional repressor [Sphingomonas sp. ABOLD]
MSHLTDASPELIARVRRIAGQVAAVERELVAGAPCGKVLHLVAAVRGAVNGLVDEIIAEHLEAHVAGAGLTDEARAQGAADLLAVIRRYSK